MKFTDMTVVSMMSLLVACGGGGGGASSPSPSVAPAAPIVEAPVDPIVEPPVVPPVELPVEPDPNATYETTAELIASKSFLLKPEYELTISYKNKDSRRAYLSICTEFTDLQGSIKVNYNSCLLRTSIESDFAGTLTVANDKNHLVMAIWYLDDTGSPRYETWENDLDTSGPKAFNVN
jgi:hypothetical protein